MVNALMSTRVSTPRIGTSFGIATRAHMEDSVEAAFLEKHYVCKPRACCKSQ